MEFKDRMKKLRQEKNISQQELAKAIYVSRSAVAKWENGLGIPGEASYQALLAYFGLTSEQFPLNEETERVNVRKNQKIHILTEVLMYLILLLFVFLTFYLLYALDHGYGFTSKMAAGEFWQEEEVIHTPKYDFYVDVMDLETEEVIHDFCAVKKVLFGYQKMYVDGYPVISSKGEHVGDLYSFKGKQEYYHFFRSSGASVGGGVRIWLFDAVQIRGKMIPVTQNSYFVTSEEVTSFHMGEDGELLIVRRR